MSRSQVNSRSALVEKLSRVIKKYHGWGGLLGVVAKQEGKMVLWSDQIIRHITVRMIPLYWRKETGRGWLGVTLMLLGKM